MCYHAEFSRSASKDVGINRGTPELGSTEAPTPLGRGTDWPLRTSPIPICVTVSYFDRSVSQGVGMNKGEPPTLGSAWVRPFGMGTCWSPEEHLFPTCATTPSFFALPSNGTSVITEIRPKKMIPCVPPFKVTQSHRNRHGSIDYDICDFLLTSHSNHWPISYRFSDKRWFQSKIDNFLIPVYLTSPMRDSTEIG